MTWEPTHKHVKSGKIYRVLSTDAIMESNLEKAVVYEGLNGQVWVRPFDEFMDGRFELITKGRKLAPWPDYEGNPIREGDTLIHPSGEFGTVIFKKIRGPDEQNQWLLEYGPDNFSRLCLQIGSKGRALVQKIVKKKT